MREGKYDRGAQARRRHICDGCCNTCRHSYNYCGGACSRKLSRQHDEFVLEEQLAEVVENQELAA